MHSLTVYILSGHLDEPIAIWLERLFENRTHLGELATELLIIYIHVSLLRLLCSRAVSAILVCDEEPINLGLDLD